MSVSSLSTHLVPPPPATSPPWQRLLTPSPDLATAAGSAPELAAAAGSAHGRARGRRAMSHDLRRPAMASPAACTSSAMATSRGSGRRGGVASGGGCAAEQPARRTSGSGRGRGAVRRLLPSCCFSSAARTVRCPLPAASAAGGPRAPPLHPAARHGRQACCPSALLASRRSSALRHRRWRGAGRRSGERAAAKEGRDGRRRRTTRTGGAVATRLTVRDARTEPRRVRSVPRNLTGGGNPHLERISSPGAAPLPSPLIQTNQKWVGSNQPSWLRTFNQTHGKIKPPLAPVRPAAPKSALLLLLLPSSLPPLSLSRASCSPPPPLPRRAPPPMASIAGSALSFAGPVKVIRSAVAAGSSRSVALGVCGLGV